MEWYPVAFTGSTYYQIDSTGGCSDGVATQTLKDANFDVYQLGKEIPASTFQEATMEIMEP